MIRYRCHFTFMGVWLVFEMHLDNQHSSIDEACEMLGKKLDAAFVYKEEIEE